MIRIFLLRRGLCIVDTLFLYEHCKGKALKINIKVA